jgi:predicted Zn-dependent protease
MSDVQTIPMNLSNRLDEVEATTRAFCPACKTETKGVFMCKVCGTVKRQKNG